MPRNGVAEDEKSNRESIECVCPECGCTHYLNIWFTGRGKPRKYCGACRDTVAGVEVGMAVGAALPSFSSTGCE